MELYINIPHWNHQKNHLPCTTNLKKPVSAGNLFMHRTILNNYVMLGSCCVLHGYQAVGVLQ